MCLTFTKVRFLTISHTSRWSSLRARRLFLTTYMDPFYPGLHLHVTNPDLLRMASSSSGNFSSYDTHKNSGWVQSIKILWYHLSDSLCALPNILWEASTDPPRTITWSPTWTCFYHSLGLTFCINLYFYILGITPTSLDSSQTCS